MPDAPSFEADPEIYGPVATGSVSLPKDDYWRQFYGQQAWQQGQAVSPYLTNQDQARTQQMQVIQDLQRAAAGDPNSRAQQQLANSYGQARAQQASLGSTMRGQSAGAAMRGIGQGQAGIQRGFAGDQQMLQQQEQQAAQAMLAQLLAQQQGQDITQAQMMAQGQLGNQQLDDAMRQFYLSGALNSDLLATEQQNQIARAQLGFNDQMSNLAQQLGQAGAGALAGALGTASTFGSKPGGTNG